MAQLYFPEQDLKVGEQSTAFWSRNIPDNLIIFIHGFNGKAKSTWDNFPGLIGQYKEFGKCDVIFYGYDGLNVAAEYSAIKFKKFIDDMFFKPFSFIAKDIKKFGKRPDNFRYKKILLVAHSLGAIITRRALLNGKNENLLWVDNTKMILFAPAHNGASDIEGLVSSVITGPLKLLTTLGQYTYVVLDDLKEDSLTIKNIVAETNNFLAKGEGGFTKAAAVVWAEKDKIVKANAFCADPPPIPIDDKTHTSVCKPNQDEPYLAPIDIIKKFI